MKFVKRPLASSGFFFNDISQNNSGKQGTCIYVATEKHKSFLFIARVSLSVSHDGVHPLGSNRDLFCHPRVVGPGLSVAAQMTRRASLCLEGSVAVRTEDDSIVC